jgi:lysophospholipase L1-like esterase
MVRLSAVAVIAQVLTVVCASQAVAQPGRAVVTEKLEWHEISAEQVEGRGWRDVQSPFDRLPARAEQLVRPVVWDLSHFSAGMNFCFATDSSTIAVRWTLTAERTSMSHMPATGVSGLDLYVKKGDQWHFLAVARPTAFPTNEVKLIEKLDGQHHQYRVYLPLYNGVSKLEIGVLPGHGVSIEAPDAKAKPVVVYGTSITHGGCASRPGMAYPAILGRRLGVPVLNLGFSGNGKAEPEVAKLLAELDPAVFVLDPLPNLTADDVRQRMPEFIRILREHRPATPIVLVDGPVYPDTAFVAERADRVQRSSEYLTETFKAAVAAGDRHITLAPGCDLSAGAGEATVDGVHPTDLGFTMMADALEPHVRAALDSSPADSPN